MREKCIESVCARTPDLLEMVQVALRAADALKVCPHHPLTSALFFGHQLQIFILMRLLLFPIMERIFYQQYMQSHLHLALC